MALNGNIFVVSIGNTPIAGAKSDDIEVSCETIEVASPSQSDFREFMAGRKEWNINTNYLVQASSALHDANSGLGDVLNVGKTYSIAFMHEGWYYYLHGSAILTKCVIRATKGSLVQGSFAFKGTGELQYSTP